MGKFTEEYFVFPIKIYDGYSLKRAMKQEEESENEGPVPVDWVVGHVRIPGRDMYKAIWHDGFSRERTVSEVADKGFDLTVVLSDVYGDFVCTWPRKKFEAKLDEFMEQYEEVQRKNLEKAMGATGITYVTGFDPYKDASLGGLTAGSPDLEK